MRITAAVIAVVVLSLPVQRFATAGEMISNWGRTPEAIQKEKDAQMVGDSTGGSYGPFISLTYSKCPWYLDTPFILVAEEKISQDPVELRKSIAKHTKFKGFDKAPVISAQEFFKQALKALPQHRKRIKEDEDRVMAALYKKKKQAVACRIHDVEMPGTPLPSKAPRTP